MPASSNVHTIPYFNALYRCLKNSMDVYEIINQSSQFDFQGSECLLRELL